MNAELVATGDAQRLLMVSRRKTAPLGQLGPKQLAWLEQKGWIDRRRFVPMEKKP